VAWAYKMEENLPEIDVLNMEPESMIDSWEYCRKVLICEIGKGDAYNAD